MRIALGGFGGRRRAAFTLIELLVVVSIVLILSVVAVTSLRGVRVKKMRAEVTQSLPGLRGFETSWWDRTGGFLYSRPTNLDVDRIRWTSPGFSECEGRVTNTSFQVTMADATLGFTPMGCQWQYFVINDRCDTDCTDDGANDACQGSGNCFCVIAEARPDLPLIPEDERFCMDDLGRQFATTDAVRGWQ